MRRRWRIYSRLLQSLYRPPAHQGGHQTVFSSVKVCSIAQQGGRYPGEAIWSSTPAIDPKRGVVPGSGMTSAAATLIPLRNAKTSEDRDLHSVQD
jgi:hypothetical protein